MDDELVQLATVYEEPGHLLLATVQSERAGCVGLRSLGVMGEVRRLFVRPAFRKTGAGRLLMTALTERASRAGLERLVLNTLPEMTAAQALYESVGFTQCEPYVDEPLEDTLYFELVL